MGSIPMPSHVSDEARQILTRVALAPWPPLPSPDDKDLWRQMVAESEASEAKEIEETIAEASASATIEKLEIAGAVVYRAIPDGIPPANAQRRAMDMHGGSLVFGGGREVAINAYRTSRLCNCTVYSME